MAAQWFTWAQNPLMLAAMVLLLSGALGFAWQRDMLRRIIAFNLMSSGVFLLLALTITPDSLQTPLLQLLLVLFMAVTTVLSAVVLHLRARLQQLTGVTEVPLEPEQEHTS